MLQAILEAVTTFGPMVFLMLTPVLIPLTVELVGAITDRRTLFARAAAPDTDTTATALPTSSQLTQAQLTKAS
jgi:hypothetical protein